MVEVYILYVFRAEKICNTSLWQDVWHLRLREREIKRGCSHGRSELWSTQGIQIGYIYLWSISWNNLLNNGMSTPKIEPMKMQDFTSSQSKYEFSAKLPTRSLIPAPSEGGKTVLLQNMILDIYRDCFSRIYIFSPSIDRDMTWEPVKDYLRHEWP